MSEPIIVSRGLGGKQSQRLTGIGELKSPATENPAPAGALSLTAVAGLIDSKAPGNTYIVPSATNLIDSRALTAHTHFIADIKSLQDVLDNKAPLVHGHAASSITYAPAGITTTATDIQAALLEIEWAVENKVVSTQYASPEIYGAVKIGSGILVDNGVISVSTNYAAVLHSHTAADITDFTSAVIAAAPPTTDASLLTTGTISAARLGSGTANSSTFLRGDGVWAVVQSARRFAGTGGVSYLGRAPLNAAETAEIWQIKKTVIAADGSVTSSLTATNVSWLDRETATYS
jgi:hypothetical protein